MVSDRVYRKGRSPQEAFDELRRCAGVQFDPELVETFIQFVNERNRHTGTIDIVSKETALSIGLQIESLTSALESQDVPGLKAMASRLKATAAKHQVPEIGDKAAELESSLESDSDLFETLQTATELIQLCRSTQKSYMCNLDDAARLQELVTDG